jgi:hypothetical protein
VPTEIHTAAQQQQQQQQQQQPPRGPTPYFPSIMKNSTSSSSICSFSNNNSKNNNSNHSATTTKSVQVTGKKKHTVKANKAQEVMRMMKVSTSSSSLASKDSTATSTTTTTTTTKNGEVVVTARRQKRLERNRESARLSRRRRKQYLEVLEERVNQLSLDMDQGRRVHASEAIDCILQKRKQVLETALHTMDMQMQPCHPNNNPTLEHSLVLLDGPLSRTSHELLVLSTFFMQQLKSFSFPSHTKFILWLTLQGDAYFRGGRAASERLSAARIGERVRPPSGKT